MRGLISYQYIATIGKDHGNEEFLQNIEVAKANNIQDLLAQIHNRNPRNTGLIPLENENIKLVIWKNCEDGVYRKIDLEKMVGVDY